MVLLLNLFYMSLTLHFSSSLNSIHLLFSTTLKDELGDGMSRSSSQCDKLLGILLHLWCFSMRHTDFHFKCLCRALLVNSDSNKYDYSALSLKLSIGFF